MSSSLTHVRRVHLHAWEAARLQLLSAETRKKFLICSGALLAISNLNDTLRYGGDGTDPIRSGQWTTEALHLIAEKSTTLPP